MNLEITKEIPAQMLPLPSLWGVGNDYGFLEQALARRQLLESIEGYSPTVSVSLVISVHNRAKLLALCLDSISRQDYPREFLEVIVVDDGSEDRPDLVCRRSDLRNLQYLRLEPTEGYTVAATRNAGILAARNDVVLQLDPDIVFRSPDALRWLLRWFEVSKEVVVTVPRTFIDSRGLTQDAVRSGSFAIRETSESDEREHLAADPHLLKHQHMPYLYMLGFCKAYPRASALAVGMQTAEWREYGGEDQEFAYRLYERGHYCVFEPHVVAYHLSHPVTEHEWRHRGFLADRIPPFRTHHYEGPTPSRAWAPRVSIYIPVWNCERFIDQAIRSALGQTFQDIELCICNDGSDDSTGDIIEGWRRLDPRVTTVTIPHSGCAVATDTVISLARGEFLLQLDGDDVLHPQAVELMLREFDRRPWLGVVYANHIRTDERLNPVSVATTFQRFRRHLLMTCMLVNAPRMWRRRLYYQVGGTDVRLTGAIDYDLMIKMAERAPFYHLNKNIYLYRLRSNSISANPKAQHECMLCALKNALERMGLAERYEPVLELQKHSVWVSYVLKRQ